jgi:glycosyltransferase involved in cell wall biosynthesis
MVTSVLIVAHGHPELSPGGAELAAYDLFETLKRDETVKPYFLAWTGQAAYRRNDTPFCSYRNRSDEVLFSSQAFDHFLFSETSLYESDLAGFLNEIKPDIVHLHHYTRIGLEFIAFIKRLFPKTRIILTLHEYLAICNNNGQMVKTDNRSLCNEASPQRCAQCFPNIQPTEFLLRERFIKAHFEKIDVFVAPSEFLRQRYITWGLSPDRIVKIDNGTRTRRPLIPRPTGEKEGRGVFAYFGQINPYKGIMDLLRAFELISRAPAEASSGIRLVINGANLEGNKVEFIDAFSDAVIRNSGRVHFAGPYRPEDLPRLMGEVDWVVMPSTWWENAPLVIEEALAHGRPVLCSNIGGMAEKVMPGRDGFHFQAGNPHDLAGMILQLSRNHQQWDRMRGTLRRPMPLAEWGQRHLELYLN